MISSSADYKTAIVADARRILAQIIIDIIDPDMTYGTVTSTGENEYSRSDQLHDKNFDSPGHFITLEWDRWILDGSYTSYPTGDGNVGFIGNVLSGEDGTFSPAYYLEMHFSNVSVLQAASVYFSENVEDGYPVDFSVSVMKNGTAAYSESFTGNTAPSVSLSGFTVTDPDAIRVTVTKWSLPSRYVRAVEIVPGIYEKWTGDELAGLEVRHQGDFTCITIPYGTASLTIDNSGKRFDPRNKTGLFSSLEERQAVDISLAVMLPDKTPEYKRLGMFYQYSGGWKSADTGLTMRWDLVDIVGLLAERKFTPPAALPTTLGGWVAAVVSNIGVNFANRYRVDSGYSGLSVTASVEGVENLSCGDILRYICMVTGTWARADSETGDLYVGPGSETGVEVTLDNVTDYPTIKASGDISEITFVIYDGTSNKYTVQGNSPSSPNIVTVNNPFIHTTAQAQIAAAQILSGYGKDQYEITGRGDMASQIGDVDTVELDGETTGIGRRTMQTFSLNGGVMVDCRSTLIETGV